MLRYRIGGDIGGTKTDEVLMCGRDVVSATKTFTTRDFGSGVITAISKLIEDVPQAVEAIDAVMIGTTQFVNAFVQRKGLSQVAIFRVSLPRAGGVPPLAGWPDDVAAAVGSHIYMVGGGALFTGKDYAPLDEEALRIAAIDAAGKGLKSVAISANFAPLRPDLEERAAKIVRASMPGAMITLSSDVGGIGLIDRENAAVVNSALSELADRVIRSLGTALAELRISAPLYFSQNDGTLISSQMAAEYPILTCSAGPTNSLRGASFLTEFKDAIVADIGGTTTDIGFLAGGFPRETTAVNDIGGVRTNFRMPDVLSIGVGGGSLVIPHADGCKVGPESVGYELVSKGRVFGGDTLTASDIAVRAGQMRIGDPSLVDDLPQPVVDAALDDIHAQIEDAIDKIKTSEAALPLILVGGGSHLVSRPLRGVTTMVRPEYSEVANAIGAAIALVSGRVDKLFDVASLGREAALEQAKAEATSAARNAGAMPDQVEIVEVVELPMTHMKSGFTQIKVRAVGPLAALA